jgi:UDP-N-acetylglucosamine:LPS N-acetylglucosamine transferase
MKIAVAAEMAPARTFIPVLEKLDMEIMGLSHGLGAEELLRPYCSEIYAIGEGRGAGSQKRSNAQIAKLVLNDILKARSALQGNGVDLVLTCGNAGDVRKAISAANLLRIPTLHIEQDIYNPIEMIAFSNLITAPSENYKNYLQNNYGLNNVHNIGGYPMASYVSKMPLMEKEDIKNQFNVDEFVVLALGGDLKGEDIPELIQTMETLEKNVLVAPFRFSPDFVRTFVKSDHLKILEGFVDLPSIMNAAQAVVYGAGMGITIEAGLLKVPSIKIAGFHHKHASVDLAHDLGIKVLDINQIPSGFDDLKKPDGDYLIDGAQKATDNLISLINNFQQEKKSKSGFGSLKKIWNARSQFR